MAKTSPDKQPQNANAPDTPGAELRPPQPAPAQANAAEKPKTVSELRLVYESLVGTVQQAIKAGATLERTLMAEVKEKIKAAAGDVEKLKAEKRAAFAAWEAADQAEKAQRPATPEPAGQNIDNNGGSSAATAPTAPAQANG